MRKYMPLITGLFTLILAVQSSSNAASLGPAVPDTFSLRVGRTAHFTGTPPTSLILLAKGDAKERDGDSGEKADNGDRQEEKPDLRSVDWYKKGAVKKSDSKENGDDEEEGEDGEKEGEKEEKSEGFDRLWDVVTLG
jgi:hypothetical protein